MCHGIQNVGPHTHCTFSDCSTVLIICTCEKLSDLIKYAHVKSWSLNILRNILLRYVLILCMCCLHSLFLCWLTHCWSSSSLSSPIMQERKQWVSGRDLSTSIGYRRERGVPLLYTLVKDFGENMATEQLISSWQRCSYICECPRWEQRWQHIEMHAHAHCNDGQNDSKGQ